MEIWGAIAVLVGSVALLLVLLRVSARYTYREWQRLAQRYQTNYSAPGNAATLQYGKVGKKLYNGTLTIAPTAQGLYLATFALLRVSHPPVLIPWDDITQVEKEDSRYYHNYRLQVGDPPLTTLVLPRKTLMAAAAILEPKIAASAPSVQTEGEN